MRWRFVRTLLLVALVMFASSGAAVAEPSARPLTAQCLSMPPDGKVNCCTPTGQMTSGQIYWSSQTWNVYGYNGGYAQVNSDCTLTLYTPGRSGGCEKLAWAEIQWTSSISPNYTYYVRSLASGGSVGHNYLHAPIWFLPQGSNPKPWSGEMDIEHAHSDSTQPCYGVTNNYRYNLWLRYSYPPGLDPYPGSLWWTNNYTAYITSDAIRWYGSGEPYSVYFSTYYYNNGWKLAAGHGHTDDNVTKPEDNVRVRLSVYTHGPSSGSSSRKFYYFGFAS